MTKDGRPSTVTTTTAVQVALRIRPLTDRDRAQPRFANLSEDDCLKVTGNTVRVVPHNKLFTFDHVFGPTSQQQEIFSTLGENLVHKFIEGYNVTVLAYGQTSSGKTFTMGTAQHNGRFDEAEEGIVPRAMAHLFEALQQLSGERPPPLSFLASSTSSPYQRPVSPTSSVSSSATSLSKGSRLRPRSRLSHVPPPTPTPSRSTRLSQQPSSSSTSPCKYSVKVSFVEIYNEELNDLLNDAPPSERPPITIREDTKGHIYWTGVREVSVDNADDVLLYLEQGTKSRATGATDMNEKSSRSHAIFSVTLQQEKWSSFSHNRSESPSPLNMKRSSTKQPHDGECTITTSKFHFVDLAGSERLKRTAAQGDRRKEGININAGLHALGNVISALGDLSKRGSHVPYRDSKLTRLLQDSLGGNATTLMIACASPVEFNLSETLNTLQYANRARNIKNRSEKNQVEEWQTTDNLELLRTLIGRLKNEVNYLKSHGSSAASVTHEVYDGDGDVVIDDDMNFDHQDTDQILQEHRLIIADLQHQLEELDGEASVTRERNKVVEAELHRLRKLEELRGKKQQEDLDFEHLVEPVIEEYEKSVAKLESELSVSKAALHHSNMGLEEMQNKCDDLQRILNHQQEAMSDLQSRFTKVMEREQSNDAYIEELESKLEQSAHDSTRDQDTLNELRSRVLKWKENEENTEHYIQDLERRLAISEENHTRLAAALERLEQERMEQDSIITDLQQQVKMASERGLTQQKMMLNELDSLSEKCCNLEKERDQWKQQAHHHQQHSSQLVHDIARGNSGSNNDGKNSNRSMSDHPHDDDDSSYRDKRDKANTSLKTNRRSLADERETSASYAALTVKEAGLRADEQAFRIHTLEQQLDQLGKEHKNTIKELDSVLERYHEALEQVDHLEHTSIMETTQPSATSYSTTTNSHQSSRSSSSYHDTFHSETPTTAATASLDAGDSHSEIALPPPSSMGFLLDQEMGRAQDQEHRNAVSQLEQKVSTLTGQLHQHQKELVSVRTDREQQNKSYEEYINTLKSTVQQLETEGEDANNLIRSLKQLTKDHEEFVERTVLQLDEATESNETLLKQFTNTQAVLKTLQQKHRLVIDDRDNVKKHLEQVRKEYEVLLREQKLELETAATAIATSTAAVEIHQGSHQQRKEELNRYRQQVAELEKTINDHNEHHTAMVHDLSEAKQALQHAIISHSEKMEAVMAAASKKQQELEDCVKRLEQEADERNHQHQTQLTECRQHYAERLEEEKTAIVKQLESSWMERQSEWSDRHQQLEKTLKDLDDHHRHQLEELSEAHIENLSQEKDNLIKQLESTWLARQAKWEERIQQLEEEALNSDQRNQVIMRDLSEARNTLSTSEKEQAIQRLESSWKEEQAKWHHRIQQLEQEGLDKDQQHQSTLIKLNEANAILLETEKEKAIQQLESSWNERQRQWEERSQQLKQDGLENDQRHLDMMKELSQAHNDHMEKEKAKMESSWLRRQLEWQQRDNDRQQQLEQLTSDLTARTDQVIHLEECLEKANTDLQAVQAKLSTAEGDIAELDELLQTTEGRLEQMTTRAEEADVLEKVITDAVHENEVLTEKLKLLEEQLQHHKDSLELESEKDRHNDLLTEALGKVELVEQQLLAQSQQHGVTVSTLQKELDELQQRLEREKDTYESEIRQLSSSHEQQTKILETELDTIKQQQLHAQAQSMENATKLQQLQQWHRQEQASQHSKLIEEHNSSISNLRQQHEDELSAAKQTYEEELSALRQKYDNKIAVLQKKYDDEISHYKSQQKEHETAASADTSSALEDQVKSLQTQLASTEASLQQSPTSTIPEEKGNDRDWQCMVEENEEYAELTKTLEEELDRVTQELNKLVIEVGDNEVTLNEQTERIQQLETEKGSASAASKAEISRVKKEMQSIVDTLKNEHVADLARQLDDQTIKHRDQIHTLEQMTQRQQQDLQETQNAWDQDKRQKEKLAKQVKVLEERLDMILQEKKKFLCF